MGGWQAFLGGRPAASWLAGGWAQELVDWWPKWENEWVAIVVSTLRGASEYLHSTNQYLHSTYNCYRFQHNTR